MSTVLRPRRRVDLSWLRPPKVAEDGRMALVDHLREFRYRLMVSVAAIIVMAIVAWQFFTEMFRLITWPLSQATAAVHRSHPSIDIKQSYEGLASPLLLHVELSVVAAVIVSCPVWMYQIWAFIVPGLYARERKWALRFLGSAIPLFLLGIATGYLVLPKAYQFMLDFVPNDQNALALLEVNQFLSTEMKLVMLFGISFLLPVILVTLNVVGVLKGEQLRRFRKFGVFLCFLFGAVATPSTDPFSMTALAIPMSLLYLVAEVICVRNDKRKAASTDMVVTL